MALSRSVLPPSSCAAFKQNVTLAKDLAMKAVERDWLALVEQTLADPKLTEAEAAFLECIPDLFKTTREEFEAATAMWRSR